MLANHKTDHAVWYRELQDLVLGGLCVEGVRVTDVHLGVRTNLNWFIVQHLVIPHDLVNHVLGLPILVIGALYEHIAHACSRHVLLGDLHLGTALELELTDSFPAFSNN